MAGDKLKVEFEIQADALAMLTAAAGKYELADRSKALRCILDYVIKDGDPDVIFGRKRCVRCGGRPGWQPEQAPG